MSTHTLNEPPEQAESIDAPCCVPAQGEGMLQLEEAELLAARFKALSDPNRLRILSIVSSNQPAFATCPSPWDSSSPPSPTT